jgi:hypothetical protein
MATSPVSKLLDGIRAAAVAIRLEPPSPGWLVWAEWAQEHVGDGVEAYQRALARALVSCRVGKFHLPESVSHYLRILTAHDLLPGDWQIEVMVLVDQSHEERQKNLVTHLELPKKKRDEERWSPGPPTPRPPS